VHWFGMNCVNEGTSFKCTRCYDTTLDLPENKMIQWLGQENILKCVCQQILIRVKMQMNMIRTGENAGNKLRTRIRCFWSKLCELISLFIRIVYTRLRK